MIPDRDHRLESPISTAHPAGEELSFAPELDQIRAARQGDDPALAQGEWVHDLRTPQWARVRDLCRELLATRSKDLQVAVWHAEALAFTDGFPGLASGLGTVAVLLDRFWPFCHPALEPGTTQGQAWEERIGRLEWLNHNGAAAVRRIPLAARDAGGHDLLAWEEARRVDSLAPRAREAAVREGRLAGEVFQKAAAASGPAHFQRLGREIAEAAAACAALADIVARRFHPDPPSLGALAEAIGACARVAEAGLGRAAPEPAPARAGPPPAAAPPPPPGPEPGRTREDAIRELRGLALWFRAREPHSPVAPLVERAAEWAEMPLGRWLGAVIKDPATLAQIRELLALEP
jgi:type VI secretion system protein ImpA